MARTLTITGLAFTAAGALILVADELWGEHPFSMQRLDSGTDPRTRKTALIGFALIAAGTAFQIVGAAIAD